MMHACALFTIATIGLSSGGCITYYSESADGRPRYLTTGDASGFSQTRPDGTVTVVQGGTNSTGQKHAWDFAGTAVAIKGAVDMLDSNNAADVAMDGNAAGVENAKTAKGAAKDAEAANTARAQISADL